MNIVILIAMGFFGIICGSQIFTLHTNIPVFLCSLLAMLACVCLYVARAEAQDNLRQGDDDE